MADRLAFLALVVTMSVHLFNLWPLPTEVAEAKRAFWIDMRAKANAIDLSKSDRPNYDAKLKAETLRDIDAVLSNPDHLLSQARFHWTLFLGAAVVAALGAITVFRRWRHWPWLAAACAVVFFWLYRPLTSLKFFYVDGRLDFAAGVSQFGYISQYPIPFWSMVVVSLFAIVLVAVAAYGFVVAYKRAFTKGAANAP